MSDLRISRYFIGFGTVTLAPLDSLCQGGLEKDNLPSGRGAPTTKIREGLTTKIRRGASGRQSHRGVAFSRRPSSLGRWAQEAATVFVCHQWAAYPIRPWPGSLLDGGTGPSAGGRSPTGGHGVSGFRATLSGLRARVVGQAASQGGLEGGPPSLRASIMSSLDDYCDAREWRS